MPIIAKVTLEVNASGKIRVVLRNADSPTILNVHTTAKGNNKPMVEVLEYMRSQFDIVAKPPKSKHSAIAALWTLKTKAKSTKHEATYKSIPSIFDDVPLDVFTKKASHKANVPTPDDVAKSLCTIEVPTWWKRAIESLDHCWVCPGGKHGSKFVVYNKATNYFFCQNGQHKPKSSTKIKLNKMDTYVTMRANAKYAFSDVSSKCYVCEVKTAADADSTWGNGWCGKPAVVQVLLSKSITNGKCPNFVCKKHYARLDWS